MLSESALPDQAFDDDYFLEGKYMSLLPKSVDTQTKLKAGAGGELATADGFNRWKTQWLERIRKEGVLQLPVLVYWGQNDPASPVSDGKALYDILSATNPRVRMIVADHGGHFTFREYPEEFVSNVTMFIDYWKNHGDDAQISSNPLGQSDQAK